MRAGLSDEEIRVIIAEDVIEVISKAIIQLFGLLKTMMIKKFVRCYDAFTQAAAAIATRIVVIVGFQRGGAMQYRELSHAKPPEFKSDKKVTKIHAKSSSPG